ncbi:MAG: PaaI family thioesterase [Taibaiella sp.]|nr:PaaI family thioesterase [Taibaiella sp.]
MEITLALLQQQIGKTNLKTPSGAGTWMNLTLTDIQKGEARLKMRIRPEMCNPYGMIHGGMMSLLIDESIGWAIISLESQANYTSLNLMVDFLYAAAVGEEITAHAYIVRKGKKIINAEVKVYNKDHVLLSKATSNLIVTSLPKKDPHA